MRRETETFVLSMALLLLFIFVIIPSFVHAQADSDQELDSLLKKLQSPDAEVQLRWEAAMALGHLGDQRAVQPLIEALKDPNRDVRLAAAEALGYLRDKRAVPHLIAALKDPNRDVRLAAAWSLGYLEDKRAVPHLIAALKHRDKYVRLDAAEALGYLEDKRAVPHLIAALKDPNRDVRWAAAEALGYLRDKRAVPHLIAALKDRDKYVRCKAAGALERLEDKRAVPHLIAALKDPNRDVRWAAAEALGHLGDQRAVPHLIAALKHRDKYVRLDAAMALGHLEDKGAVQPLIEALKDRDKYVRWAAAGALERLGDKRAVQPLIEALKDLHGEVRCAAKQALIYLGLKTLEGMFSECPAKRDRGGDGWGDFGPRPAPSPLNPKGNDKIMAFWNTWFENQDKKTRVEELKKDATYSFVLDISKYAYFSDDSSVRADSFTTDLIEKARKEGKTTIRLRIRAFLPGDVLRFTDDNQHPWKELKVDINKLIKANKNVEDDNEKKKEKLSLGQIKLSDFAQKVQAGEVKFDLLAERAGDATIFITIWDEKGMIPLDHLSVSVHVMDENTPAGSQKPVRDTFPLKAGRQTLLNISSDFSTIGPLAADAAFYVFEKSPNKKSMIFFAAKKEAANPGTSEEVSVYAWETISLLSNYIEDRLHLIKLIRDARDNALSVDENVRKYSYQSAAEDLREKIFSGLNERDQKQAAAAEKVFRDLVNQQGRRSIVFARMRNKDGNSVYLPLGILAANSSSRILEKRITLVQPLPRENYPAGVHPVINWVFNVPNELPEIEDERIKTALGKLPNNPPYLRDIATVRAYFQMKVAPTAGASPEGVMLLSHQAGGNVWFMKDTDRITPEKIKRRFPAGSVAILSACSAASSEGNNQVILERLNTNGIDAMIISPFPVDPEYGAMLAIQFVQAIEDAKKNSQTYSVEELFSMASEKTAKHFKEKQNINYEDMDLEFLIAGDYRINIAPKKKNGGNDK